MLLTELLEAAIKPCDLAVGELMFDCLCTAQVGCLLIPHLCRVRGTCCHIINIWTDGKTYSPVECIVSSTPCPRDVAVCDRRQSHNVTNLRYRYQRARYADGRWADPWSSDSARILSAPAVPPRPFNARPTIYLPPGDATPAEVD